MGSYTRAVRCAQKEFLLNRQLSLNHFDVTRVLDAKPPYHQLVYILPSSLRCIGFEHEMYGVLLICVSIIAPQNL